MAKHTPGPWTMKDYGGIIEVQCSNKVPVVKWGGFDECLRTAKEHRANANLIATAPELLEALKDLVALVRSKAPDLYDLEDRVDIARKVIMKAEGE